MSTKTATSTRYRRTTTQLRKLRLDAGLSALTVAERLNWCPSKLTRIELGRRDLRPDDVAEYLRVVGAKATERKSILRGLLAETAAHWWWNRHLEVPDAWRDAVDLESRAASVTVYASTLLPEVVQTADYAAAVLANSHPEMDESARHRRVTLTMSRQLVLFNRRKLPVTIIVDEPVLRRRVLPRAGGQDQLNHLKRLAARVDLRVVPDTHLHPGLSTHAFTLLTFRDEPTTLHTDGRYPAIDSPGQIAEYRHISRLLLSAALPPAESLALIGSID
ncbi:helix-turn-helix domain-containing protein [Actinokineospora enzanensis]|uniref:helix-turn-helix domain-containing protein n=1 Tax=Actinokineospora enzanensis TaxID=155975 RepID=UPI00037166F8|nr:helix-turn-helix transcriptional regulator [Actinokineospora enzanensis]